MKIDLEIERVVEEYADMIYRLALSYLENKDDAEDIVQDVMIKYISFIKTNRFNDKDHERFWLTRVTMNLCYNEVKSAKRNNVVFDDYMLNVTEDMNNNEEIF